TQRAEHGLLVGQCGPPLGGFSSANLRPHASTIEDAPRNHGDKPEATASGVEQLIRIERLETTTDADRELREQFGGGHANIGTGSCELTLGDQNIRPPAQKV